MLQRLVAWFSTLRPSNQRNINDGFRNSTKSCSDVCSQVPETWTMVIHGGDYPAWIFWLSHEIARIAKLKESLSIMFHMCT